MIDLKLNPSRRELKWFAVLHTLFLAFVASVVYRSSGSTLVPYVILGIALPIGVLGFFAPQCVRWIYVAWAVAAFPIGLVVSHVFMAVFFFLVFTPAGLLMRLCGRDPMNRRFDKKAKSYWIIRPPQQGTKRYFRQF